MLVHFFLDILMWVLPYFFVLRNSDVVRVGLDIGHRDKESDPGLEASDASQIFGIEDPIFATLQGLK